MASEAQIRANQENAKKSTGPKTEEGKSKSSKNSIKHGIFSSSVSLSCEDPNEYEEILNLLIDEFGPTSTLELVWISTMAKCVIKQNRLNRAEIARHQLRTMNSSILPEVIDIHFLASGMSETEEITTEDLNDKKSAIYNDYHKSVLDEISRFKKNSLPTNEISFKDLYPQLHDFLLKIYYDRPTELTKLFLIPEMVLQEVNKHHPKIEKLYAITNKRVMLQDIAHLVRESHLIPDPLISDRFQRYQADIHRELRLAMDGLIKARKIAEKPIDGIAIEVHD